jgi:hypothetical protein
MSPRRRPTDHGEAVRLQQQQHWDRSRTTVDVVDPKSFTAIRRNTDIDAIQQNHRDSAVPSAAAACSVSPPGCLPFANEDVGTLKQRTTPAAALRPPTTSSRYAVTDVPGSAAADDEDDDGDSTYGGRAGPFDNDFDDDTIKRGSSSRGKGGGEERSALNQAGSTKPIMSSSRDVSSETLFGDIDVMLVGLAAELEEMLNLRG